MIPKSPHRITKLLNKEKIMNVIGSQPYKYISHRHLNDVLGIRNCSKIHKLFTEEGLIICKISLRKGTGKRNNDTVILEEKYREKTYICLDRTAFVRLMTHAVKKPTNPINQRVLTYFLNRHLTHAETLAILWMKGIRHFKHSQRKRNIQINGIYFPIKRHSESRRYIQN